MRNVVIHSENSILIHVETIFCCCNIGLTDSNKRHFKVDEFWENFVWVIASEFQLFESLELKSVSSQNEVRILCNILVIEAMTVLRWRREILAVLAWSIELASLFMIMPWPWSCQACRDFDHWEYCRPYWVTSNHDLILIINTFTWKCFGAKILHWKRKCKNAPYQHLGSTLEWVTKGDG